MPKNTTVLPTQRKVWTSLASLNHLSQVKIKLAKYGIQNFDARTKSIDELE
jgi:hypothetical protein